MTNEEAIESLRMMNLKSAHPFLHWEEMMEVRDMAITALEKQSFPFETIEWHKVVTRKPTEEEKKDFEDILGIELCYVFDCQMPDDGDEILVATKYGVDKDICCIDDGYYLEGRGDWDDVIAWAYMPKYAEVTTNDE